MATDIATEVFQNSNKCPNSLNDAVLSQKSKLLLDCIKKEIRQSQWRESKKRQRSIFSTDPESQEKRKKRLQDQRVRTSLARKKMTETEKNETRRKHQVYKAERFKNENNNQRFWRLIKGRQFRKKRYHNTAIRLRYAYSLGMYGFTKPTFPNCTSPDDKFVELQIWRFYYILKKVLSDSPIPEDMFETFAERGIDLPKHFFIDFIKEQERVESQV